MKIERILPSSVGNILLPTEDGDSECDIVSSWAVSEMHTAVKSVLLMTLVLVF